MHPHKYLMNRIAAVWIALSFLPVLLAVSPVQKDSSPRNYFTQESCSSHPELERFVTLICTEEFLPSKAVQTYRCQPTEKLTRLKGFHFFFQRVLQLSIAVCILFVFLWLSGETNTYSQKYIIQYMQNQDGQKGSRSV